MRAAKAVTAEAAFIEDADQIDHDILAPKALAQLRFLVDIAVLERQSWEYQQVFVLFPITGQHGDAMAVLDQPSDQPGPQEPGAAENAKGQQPHCLSESESEAARNRGA